jgi:hypothetical protein
MHVSEVNWLAVIVGTVFTMVLGFLWYGPLLGKPWLAAMERTGRKRSDMKMGPVQFLLPLVGAFVSAAVLDIIIMSFGGSAWWMGLMVGLVVWIGVGMSAIVTAGLFEGRPTTLILISFFYYVIIYGAMGVLFTVWK